MGSPISSHNNAAPQDDLQTEEGGNWDNLDDHSLEDQPFVPWKVNEHGDIMVEYNSDIKAELDDHQPLEDSHLSDSSCRSDMSLTNFVGHPDSSMQPDPSMDPEADYRE